MADRYTLLLIDDDKEWGLTFISELSKYGFEIKFETEAENSIKRIRSDKPDAVLLDIMWPAEDGSHTNKGKPTFEKIKKKDTTLPVIMLTNTLAGDFFNDKDYIGAAFPYGKDAFESGDEKAYERFAELIKEEIQKAKGMVSDFERYGFIVGKTDAMKEVCKKIDMAASSNATVLITGETGAGKELVARAIHKLSNRKGPLVAVNCGALTETLLESELFGHEKGAFTDAKEIRKGFFETAAGGTIFLDEIGDASQKIQVRLLRALREREITRVGSATTIKVDVKVISATNKDIGKEIKLNRFRGDLYYRLNVIEIKLPLLKERKEDIEELAKYFTKRFDKNIRMETFKLLKNYNWPGNIAELENVITSAAVQTKSNWLLPKDFEFLKKQEDDKADLGNINEIIQEIWNKNLTLKKLMEDHKQKGLETIIKGLVDRWLSEKRTRPKHKDLAELLDTTDEIIRQIFRKCGLELTRDWPKKKVD